MSAAKSLKSQHCTELPVEIKRTVSNLIVRVDKRRWLTFKQRQLRLNAVHKDLPTGQDLDALCGKSVEYKTWRLFNTNKGCFFHVTHRMFLIPGNCSCLWPEWQIWGMSFASSGHTGVSPLPQHSEGLDPVDNPSYETFFTCQCTQNASGCGSFHNHSSKYNKQNKHSMTKMVFKKTTSSYMTMNSKKQYQE